VAKEYVAAQDPEDPGVLILSAFAGAAEQLHDALLVNPYDGDEVADALERARTMGLEERIERHRSLVAVLRRDSSDHWQASYLRALEGGPAAPDAGQGPPRSSSSKRTEGISSRRGSHEKSSASMSMDAR
jgi:trehalose 6-phosphate synthase